jgi:hypothetical protein
MLFSILLGLVPKLGSWFVDYLGKRSDNELEKIKATIGGDVQLNVAELRYKVEIARMAADMRKDDREHWFTAWMVPCAFSIFIIHIAAVVFDSIPLFGHEVGSWAVSKLPGIYADMQYNIVMTICGVAGIASIKKIFTR